MNFNFQKLLGRYLNGECTGTERKQVEAWMNNNPDYRKQVEKLMESWDEAGELNLNFDEEHSWEVISKHISESGRITATVYPISQSKSNTHGSNSFNTQYRANSNFSRMKWFMRVAAILLIAAGLTYLFFDTRLAIQQNADNGPESERFMREIVTKDGEKASVTFSDGTEVILNSNSVLRFPEVFEKDVREVELVEGEAFFSVEHNEEKPFLVHTTYADVRVLGTMFNVNAHLKDKNVEVVVAQGTVAINSAISESDIPDQDSGDDRVVLTKGEFSDVSVDRYPSPPRKVRLKPYLGWVQGMLVFDDDPLREVLTKLSRYYNVDFEVSDAAIYDRRLTAVFKQESLSTVIKVIALSTGMNYSKQEGKILLQPN